MEPVGAGVAVCTLCKHSLGPTGARMECSYPVDQRCGRRASTLEHRWMGATPLAPERGWPVPSGYRGGRVVGCFGAAMEGGWPPLLENYGVWAALPNRLAEMGDKWIGAHPMEVSCVVSTPYRA